jgi:hypothetical protein
MKKLLSFLLVPVFLGLFAQANEPDSVYLFSYATNKNNNHNGLQFAWSTDREHWFAIGNEFGFVKSDYGTWGAEKRMITPYLLQAPGGYWQLVWSLNEKDKVFAHASSVDLLDWGRQSYPVTKNGINVLRPVVQYNQQQKQYTVTYTDANAQHFSITTKDFKTFTSAVQIPASQYNNPSITILLQGASATGQLHRVAWPVVDKLIKTCELQQFKSSLYNESPKDDAQRFAGLAPVNARITIQPQKAKPISDLLMGIFFEDINYAADGGLYAELVQNRGFEYNPADKKGRDRTWSATHSWSVKGENAVLYIDSATPVHVNNPHYAVLETKGTGASLVNAGFDGIPVKNGEQYHVSLYAKSLLGGGGKLLIRLRPGISQCFFKKLEKTFCGFSAFC